ncbi:MAG: hypothetical protein JEZ00_13870 [Anaerolineaceae bacterium]|nr:hypothetical protein [Anaerolineaceae bacterium]
MNKSKVFFLFILFIAFGFLGFLITNGVKGLFSTNDISAPPPDTGQIQQRNFLIVHVDDLQSEDTQLVSIWAIFFFPSDPPSLTMKELYPHPYQNEDDMAIQDSFEVTTNGELNNKLIKKLNTYQINWSGYILIDHLSVLHITNWLQMAGMPESLEQAIQIPGTYVQAADEEKWFDQICTQVENEDLQNLQHVPWTTLIPDHMHTNLYFDDMVTFWDTLARSQIPPHCEVLVP